MNVYSFKGSIRDGAVSDLAILTSETTYSSVILILRFLIDSRVNTALKKSTMKKMLKKIRLGVLVPSSNTVLEPLTQKIIASIQDPDVQVSVHFSRFSVTRIDLSSEARAQFELERILSAADLLADAKVHVIGWSGTSAGWLGFETDEKLCAAVERRTKIQATTSTLALNRVLKIWDISRTALLTPYTEEMNVAIQSNYATLGVDMELQGQALGITDNTKIAEIDERFLDVMISDLARDRHQTFVTFCTNLRAAQQVAYWEEKHNGLVFDTVSTVVWDMLRISGLDTRVVKGWGRMFDQNRE